MADEVDAVDDLYGLPLDRFVAERDALAKRLRADGRRAEADEVKALRRPSVAAWGVNQVVRSQGRAARALWDAGDALIDAQDALLEGRADAKALRAASEREREALDALVHAARGLLTGEGRDLGEATIERVRETLHAAAIDPASREDVAAGRATRERAHAGLGAFGGALAPEPSVKAPPKAARTPRAKAAKPAAKADRAEDRRRKADERAEAERREREDAERRERERKDAARRRASAERELRDAQRVLAGAERRAGKAQERLAEAQAAAEEAGAGLDAAREREASARAALEDARGRDKRA